MNEQLAKKHLTDMLRAFRPGSVLHLLGEVLRDAESERLGGLDDAAEERVREAGAALFVMGLGINAACPW